MLPSGAAAGPSVRPPVIGAVRVNSRSSLAPGGTMPLPEGSGVSSAARAVPQRKGRVKARVRRLRKSGEGPAAPRSTPGFGVHGSLRALMIITPYAGGREAGGDDGPPAPGETPAPDYFLTTTEYLSCGQY